MLKIIFKTPIIFFFIFFAVAANAMMLNTNTNVFEKPMAPPNLKDEVFNVQSPNGKLNYSFYQKATGDGTTQMYYKVSFNNQPVILESELGVLIENNLFESALAIENDLSKYWCENLELKSIDRDTVHDFWEPIYGERNVVKNHYNQLVLHFNKFGEKGKMETGENGTSYDKRRSYNMDVIVRVYNEGVAFRYYFPETSNGLFLHIEGEQTSYTLPEGTMAYYERWAQGPYSYLPLKNWPDESERPLTLDLKNGLHVALLEAQMIDYSRGKFKLSEAKPNTINLSMYDKVDVITPYATPWRVIMVAEKPGELLENNDIILNLNKPNQIKNTSWIKPGKVIRANLSTKEAKECVDFAAQRNLQYVHLDAGWYGSEMKMSSDATTISKEKDIDIQELVNYAASKNVGIFVYINQRALTDKLDEVFTQCRKWGIKGVKFGFVQIGSSRWSNWLHKAIEKAAEYHLLVDVHDEYRPTGFSRTYPNLMTQEGIRGNEEMPDATHNTILPFTRYLAGAGDYTICYYNNRIKTTHAHQLALSVVYYSPIQFMYWYDKPSFYQGEKEIAFFDNVKTVWEDTKILNGEIGKYIITARKSGDDWFVGGITNNDARDVVVYFDFLEARKQYKATLYYDDDKLNTRTNVGIQTLKLKRGKTMKLQLKPSGGFAIHIQEIE
ncbi:glycoside hydrolase family 97 catalytic domain-containing protein [Mariniflexile litorale]|uniref:Glycoside hydrolase family 97 catalytic domain-containing protein n=1 Tax=Mariniflexile litorale TaxID=3045158 RepID=A0AAU7ECF2_9FLAO|nr:glycoside hydrolase family 97 catalytic domain-containing protein [Mariniflexile sp. KMM 9835]MDQ8213464.1 glycoside hydrolase family 97 catalytic domain-containing protein [Mariniflexile sp. KMM 9835]